MEISQRQLQSFKYRDAIYEVSLLEQDARQKALIEEKSKIMFQMRPPSSASQAFKVIPLSRSRPTLMYGHCIFCIHYPIGYRCINKHLKNVFRWFVDLMSKRLTLQRRWRPWFLSDLILMSRESKSGTPSHGTSMVTTTVHPAYDKHLPLPPMSILTSCIYCLETTITPDMFAHILCEDLKLSPSLFSSAIARAIQEQLDEFHDHRAMGSSDSCGNDGVDKGDRDEVELRIPIKVGRKYEFED
jgi:hypothetical protein